MLDQSNPNFQRQANDMRSAREKAQRKRDRIYLWSGLLVAVLISITIIVPGINRYLQAAVTMKSVQVSIYGDSELGIVGLKDKIEQALARLELVKKEISDQNREDVDLLDKVFPLISEPKVLTNLVRIFDSIAHDWNAPERDQMLQIDTIIFGEARQEDTYTTLPVEMNVRCSETNLEQLFYFLESAGSLRADEVFDPELVRSLQGIINAQEDLLLKKLLQSDYSIESLLEFRNFFAQDKIKRRLVDRLIATPIVYKKYQLQADSRYFPLPLMTLEKFSYQAQSEEIFLQLQLNLYLRNQDLVNNVLQ